MSNTTYQPFVHTRYLGPTNFRPARVKAQHLSNGQTLIISWDHALNALDNHLAAAQALLAEVATAGGDTREPATDFVCCGTQDSRGYIFTATTKSV